MTLSPDTLYMASTGGSTSLSVTSNSTWILEGSDIVAYLSPMSGNGDANVSVVIDVNSSADPRTGFIRALHNGEVASEIIIVQEGKPDLLETDVTEITAPAEGGEYNIHVTSNQFWSAMTSELWMSITPTEGFGNGDITLTINPLNSTRPRTGTITIKAESGKKVTIEVKQQP